MSRLIAVAFRDTDGPDAPERLLVSRSREGKSVESADWTLGTDRRMRCCCADDSRRTPRVRDVRRSHQPEGAVTRRTPSPSSRYYRMTPICQADSRLVDSGRSERVSGTATGRPFRIAGIAVIRRRHVVLHRIEEPLNDITSTEAEPVVDPADAKRLAPPIGACNCPRWHSPWRAWGCLTRKSINKTIASFAFV